MRAVQYTRHGGADVLQVIDLPIPRPAPDEVLVTMRTAALNHLDIWVREGIPGVPLPMIPGSDGAGVVAAVGQNVSDYQASDEIIIQPITYCGSCRYCRSGRENYCNDFGILGETCQGTNRQYLSVKPANLRPKPANLNFAEAAAFPLVAMTAYTMLMTRARMQPEDKVLIWGAGSGIGHMAVQLAKWRGCQVIATAGSAGKRTKAGELGADLVVDHYNDNVAEAVRDSFGPRGADIVFEHVGAATWKTSLRVLAKGGRLVTCGATTGPKVELDLRHLFYKQQSILGSTMGDIPGFDKVLQLVEAGTIKPVVDRVFDLEQIREAHEYLAGGDQFGKVVITIAD